MHYATRVIVYTRASGRKRRKIALPDVVMGAECRRNVATLRGNHSLREPLLVGRRLADRLG